MTLDEKRPTFLVAWIGVICVTFWSLGQLLDPEPIPPPTRAQGALESPAPAPAVPVVQPAFRGLPFAGGFSPHGEAAERPAAQRGAGRAFSPFAAPGEQDPVTLPPPEPAVDESLRPPARDEDEAGRGHGGTRPRVVDRGRLDHGGADVQRHALALGGPARRPQTAGARSDSTATPRGSRAARRQAAATVVTRLALSPRPGGRFLLRIAVQDPGHARARAHRHAGEVPDRILDEARAWRDALEEARGEPEEAGEEAAEQLDERWLRLADVAGEDAARSLRASLSRIPGGLEFVAELDAGELERLWRRIQEQGLPARS